MFEHVDADRPACKTQSTASTATIENLNKMRRRLIQNGSDQEMV